MILIFTIVILLSLSLWFGAPYLPSKSEHIQIALKLLNLPKGHTIVDLGSGDGKVLKQAAAKGYKGLGFEINPILTWISRFRLRKYPVEIKNISFWSRPLPRVKGIYIFGTQSVVDKLDKKIQKDLEHTKLVSVGYKITGKKPDKSLNGVHLYVY